MGTTPTRAIFLTAKWNICPGSYIKQRCVHITNMFINNIHLSIWLKPTSRTIILRCGSYDAASLALLNWSSSAHDVLKEFAEDLSVKKAWTDHVPRLQYFNSSFSGIDLISDCPLYDPWWFLPHILVSLGGTKCLRKSTDLPFYHSEKSSACVSIPTPAFCTPTKMRYPGGANNSALLLLGIPKAMTLNVLSLSKIFRNSPGPLFIRYESN